MTTFDNFKTDYDIMIKSGIMPLFEIETNRGIIVVDIWYYDDGVYFTIEDYDDHNMPDIAFDGFIKCIGYYEYHISKKTIDEYFSHTNEILGMTYNNIIEGMIYNNGYHIVE